MFLHCTVQLINDGARKVFPACTTVLFDIYLVGFGIKKGRMLRGNCSIRPWVRLIHPRIKSAIEHCRNPSLDTLYVSK